MSTPDDLLISMKSGSPTGPSSAKTFTDPSPSDLDRISDDSSQVRHPVDLLADEFASRCRRGETPSIEEFEQRAPEHRTMIRSLFPTIAKIERATFQAQFKKRADRQVLPAQKVIGDFRVIREVGRGGMGIVYEAIQRSLDRRVALKVLSSGIANSPQQFQRFRREAESAARLHHTNIVPVYGIGEENGVHFYAMQYIDGIPLADAIETARHNSSIRGQSVFDSTCASHHTGLEFNPSGANVDRAVEQPLNYDLSGQTILMNGDPSGNAAASSKRLVIEPDHQPPVESNSNDVADRQSVPAVHPESSTNSVAAAEVQAASKELFSQTDRADYFRRIAHLAAQVADALDYAHQHGVLHRDIKPSNLMLDQSGMVWIMDFGLVKILEQQNLTQTGEIVGTLRYMAPEQLEGHADIQTDIYGLGLTLYELLTLRPAFDGDQINTLAQRIHQSKIPRPRLINRAIPRDLETIVLKATAHERSARYLTAGALAEDLRRFCEDRPILARRSTFVERFWRWSRRNPALAVATGTSVVLLATIAIVMTASRLKVESALLDARSALLDSKTSQKRAERDLFSAISAFDSILENVTSRGLPRSLAQNISEAEIGLMQTPLSKADALLLDRLLQFYRNFAVENADNFQLRARIADAYEQAGAILIRLGRLDEAESDFRAAIDSLTKILKSDPNNVNVVVKTASLYNELGKLRLRHGDFHQTFLAHLEARATLLDLPGNMKNDPTVRFELARATNLLASIDVRSGTDTGPGAPPFDRHAHHGPPHDGPPPDGDFPDGPPPDGPPPDGPPPDGPPPHGWPPRRRGPGNGPPVQRQMTHSPGSMPDDRRNERPQRPPTIESMSERLRNAMPNTFRSGQSIGDGLANILREASDEVRSLVSEFPERPEYQLRLAQGLRLQLVHAASSDKFDAAREFFLEARDILTRLSTRFPDEPKYLFELANTLTQASRAESDDEAKDSLGRAVEIAGQLHDRFPSTSEYQLLDGTALARLASNQAARGSNSDAEQSLIRSIELLTPLAEQFPDQGIIQIPLAKTRQQLGDLLRSLSDPDHPDAVQLERSRKELQHAIDRFEGYLSAPDENSKSTSKGQFTTETCSSLYKSLAKTLTQLQLPEQAEHASNQAARYARQGRPPHPPSP